MTQTDQNTPATATTSKRTTKAKTTAAKAAADTEVLAPVETEQSPSLDAAVNQEKTSSEVELQGIQGDTAGQNLVADVDAIKSDSEPENELIGTEQVLPEVQSPSPVKQTTAVKSGLFVVVKNTGVQTVFEPLSKTSIKSGETVEIRCSTGQFKHDVLNNLKQFIGLGKNLEIQNA